MDKANSGYKGKNYNPSHHSARRPGQSETKATESMGPLGNKWDPQSVLDSIMQLVKGTGVVMDTMHQLGHVVEDAYESLAQSQKKTEESLQKMLSADSTAKLDAVSLEVQGIKEEVRELKDMLRALLAGDSSKISITEKDESVSPKVEKETVEPVAKKPIKMPSTKTSIVNKDSAEKKVTDINKPRAKIDPKAMAADVMAKMAKVKKLSVVDKTDVSPTPSIEFTHLKGLGSVKIQQLSDIGITEAHQLLKPTKKQKDVLIKYKNYPEWVKQIKSLIKDAA